MCKRISISLMAILLAICMLPIVPQGERSYGATDVRGLWLSFVDFEDMGLRDASAATYRSKISRLLQESKAQSPILNTLSGSVRLVRPEQSSKARAPML